jgi:hypothetical protein
MAVAVLAAITSHRQERLALVELRLLIPLARKVEHSAAAAALVVAAAVLADRVALAPVLLEGLRASVLRAQSPAFHRSSAPVAPVVSVTPQQLR